MENGETFKDIQGAINNIHIGHGLDSEESKLQKKFQTIKEI